MRVDLDRIPRDRPCAIHIPTPDHGEIFLAEMRDKYPYAVSGWSRAHFYENRVESGGNYYYPRLHEHMPHMTHGNKEMYIEWGVELLSFDDVLAPEIDLGVTFGDMPIESLFE